MMLECVQPLSCLLVNLIQLCIIYRFSLYSPTSWYFLDYLALKAIQAGTMDR